MSLICNCPVGASITDIPLNACPEAVGQIQKVILQRIYSTGATRNSITNPLVKASWTPLLAAVDGTKVVQSPYISAPTTEAGAAKVYGGGDNTTLGGVEIVLGRNPTTFTGSILHSTQDTIKALKSYECEAVGVWLVNENGKIICLVDNRETPTKYYPIPVKSFFVGDKTLGGLDSVDMNAISWKFLPNWSDDLVILTPTDFNALTDLITPEGS